MSDQRSHFLNYTIQQLTQDFMIHHQKSTPYHTQANGMTETSNIILENDLTKVFY
jgi:transposase InsO family protein